MDIDRKHIQSKSFSANISAPDDNHVLNNNVVLGGMIKENLKEDKLNRIDRPVPNP